MKFNEIEKYNSLGALNYLIGEDATILDLLVQRGVEFKLLGEPEEINILLASQGEKELTDDQMNCLNNAYPFEAKFEDGTRKFLTWDFAEEKDVFFCELKYLEIVEKLNSLAQ